SYIKLHLFVTLFCSPILIGWGIPISLISPLGNFIFHPFLILFLFFSTLTFFSELICIPNALFITALDYTTKLWISLLQTVPYNSLIGFKKPPLFFLISITFCTLAIPLLRSEKVQWFSYCSLTLLLILSCSVPHYQGYHHRLPCNKGTVSFMHHNGKVIVIDPGYMGQKSSATSWARYTLLPEIIQKTGQTTINYFILLQPSYFALKALSILGTITNIEVVVLAAGQINMNALFSNYSNTDDLLAIMQNCVILDNINEETVVPIDNHNQLILKPLNIASKGGTLPYSACSCKLHINSEAFIFYPARCKKLYRSHKRLHNG
ncbi:MAG: hypothetical protein WBQ73_03465, partial [Candidatus Babeliales bacterium]